MVLPYMLIDPANFMEVDFLVTPRHIKPEWYFLFVYCILRSTPNKLGGVVLMLMAVIILVFLRMGSSNGLSRFIGGLYWKSILILFVRSFYILTVLGGCVVEPPYEAIGVYIRVCYFMVFAIILVIKWLSDLVVLVSVKCE